MGRHIRVKNLFSKSYGAINQESYVVVIVIVVSVIVGIVVIVVIVIVGIVVVDIRTYGPTELRTYGSTDGRTDAFNKVNKVDEGNWGDSTRSGKRRTEE